MEAFVFSKCRVLIICCLLVGTMHALATQVSPDSVILLREVRVSANYHKPIATVQQLSGTELQALSTTGIADALKYFAGVQIKDYGGLGGLKTINVRSLGAQHVGVYIDGIRITNAQNGNVDLGKFSLSTLESISLYNANKLDICQSPSEYASGATVYMRTRQPQTDSLALVAKAGSFSTYSGRVNAQFNRRGWKGFIDAEYLESNGDYKFRYKSQYEDTVGRRRNSDIRYSRLEAALFRGGFASHLYAYFSERGCPGGIVRRLSDKYTNIGWEWDKDCFAQASYQHRLNNILLFRVNSKYAYEYLRYCTDYPDNQNTAKVNNRYYQHDAFLSGACALTPVHWLSLNLGYDARMSWLDADLKKFSPVRRVDQKAVIAAQIDCHSIRIAASILYQHYKDRTKLRTGAADPLSRFTPAISAAYTYRNLTLKTWYKTIFRVPTLNDLYYTQAGNRNLKPEYTKQYDIGVEYAVAPSDWFVSIQADVYRNRIENRIVCLPLKGTYTWSMMNYGETLCHGLNATAKCSYLNNSWRFTLLGSLTWQRDINKTNPEDESTYDQTICYSPELSYGLTAIAAWRGFSVTLSDLHVGKRMWSYADAEDVLEPYNNIDLKITGIISRYTVSLEVNDLLDVQYEHIPRYPMPGRNFRISASISF